MFVADNRLATAKKYFFNELASLFSPSECKQMWQVLLEKRFDWSPAEQMLQLETRVSESDLLYFRSAVKRMQANEPFQYVVGDTLFAGLQIKTDQRALIPRPETEELVALISNLGLAFESILDLCTGSGCIALALKMQFPNAKVRGLDLSADAIALAQENAAEDFSAPVEARQFFFDHAGQKHPAVGTAIGFGKVRGSARSAASLAIGDWFEGKKQRVTARGRACLCEWHQSGPRLQRTKPYPKQPGFLPSGPPRSRQ